ncbi:hypothetical protein AAFF_G00398410 [Aldrovandia affinis]|uniref:C2H2-type domain-containing protein n=1 Tax=Aldrovandia affinis TaxID=143900 RepID=A0AAD7SD38_9TELE|nr:hypothetical protein AAFF_G00398410 [Aldrovandia affinis]
MEPDHALSGGPHLLPVGFDEIIALEITEVSPDLVVLQLKEDALEGHSGLGFDWDALQREGCSTPCGAPRPSLSQAVTMGQSSDYLGVMVNGAAEMFPAYAVPESCFGNLELQFYPCNVCEASFTDEQELKGHVSDSHFKNGGKKKERREKPSSSVSKDGTVPAQKRPHQRGRRGQRAAFPATRKSPNCSKLGKPLNREERQRRPIGVGFSRPKMSTAKMRSPPLQCMVCGRIFKQLRSLQRHQQGHTWRWGPSNSASTKEKQQSATAGTLNQCQKCERTFKEQKTLHRHQQIYHSKGPVIVPSRSCAPLKTMRCCECDRTFDTTETFYRHQCFHLRKQLRAFKASGRRRRNERFKFFHCQLCAVRFTGGLQFERHVRDAHPEQYRKTATNKCGARKPRRTQRSGSGKDGKSFKMQAMLDRHQKMYHHKAQTRLPKVPKSYGHHKCTKCEMTFRTARMLMKHKRMHRTKNTLKCCECDRTFGTAETFYRHRCFHLRKQLRAFKASGRRSEGVKFFHCQLCAVRFTGGLQFERHVSDAHPEQYRKNARNKCGGKTTRMQKTGAGKDDGKTSTPSSDGKEHVKTAIMKSAVGDKCAETVDISGSCNGAANTEEQGSGTPGTLHQCLRCSRTFKVHRMLDRHRWIYHSNRSQSVTRSGSSHRALRKTMSPLRCCECDRTFGTAETFYRHQCFHLRKQLRAFKASGRRSEEVKFFHCQLCILQFTTGLEFERHVRDAHPEQYRKTARTKCGAGDGCEGKEAGESCAQIIRDGCGVEDLAGDGVGSDSAGPRGGEGSMTERRYTCSDCGKHFRERYNMRRHQEAHARVAKQHNCTECGKTFSRPEHLKRHQFLHTGDPSFTCQVCDQHFRDPGRLRSHQRLHPELLMYGCRCCEERFGHAEELRAHEEGAHSGQAQLTCGKCDKAFRNMRGLRKHQLTHSNQRPFLCSLCGKGFGRREHLQRHEHVHSSEKPHACQACGKTFKHKEDLSCHSRKVHAPERKVYKCPQCEVFVHTASGLSRHLRLHGGQQPHTCHVCGKGFPERYGLKRHLSMHMKQGPRTNRGGAFKCAQCGVNLGTAAGLKQHQITHAEPKPQNCTICGKGFLGVASLRGHQQIHKGRGRRSHRGQKEQGAAATEGPKPVENKTGECRGRNSRTDSGTGVTEGDPVAVEWVQDKNPVNAANTLGTTIDCKMQGHTHTHRAGTPGESAVAGQSASQCT